MAMPSSHSQTAPFFSGCVEDSLEDFLEEYNELAKDCRLMEKQKCEMVLCYIAPSHRDLWRSLDEFHIYDWTRYCQALSQIYESTSAEGQYSQHKLLEFVKTASKIHKTEEEDVLQYYRHFILLSKPLLDSQWLTKEEQDAAFWYGFHLDDCNEMST
jgi:hypothetical protein